jgi:predicted RNA binding protein YcfA (HicA-like mRNA interferase family)
MPKLLSSKEIIAILILNGFALKSVKGSHHKYIKEKKTVIVPHPKHEIPYGTFLSITRQTLFSKKVLVYNDKQIMIYLIHLMARSPCILSTTCCADYR